MLKLLTVSRMYSIHKSCIKRSFEEVVLGHCAALSPVNSTHSIKDCLYGTRAIQVTATLRSTNTAGEAYSRVCALTKTSKNLRTEPRQISTSAKHTLFRCSQSLATEIHTACWNTDDTGVL